MLAPDFFVIDEWGLFAYVGIRYLDGTVDMNGHGVASPVSLADVDRQADQLTP
jgi:hypothetical protein